METKKNEKNYQSKKHIQNMKKIKNLLFGILAASLLAACAKDSESGGVE